MNFAYSDTALSYIRRLQQFMAEHVIPAESIYFSQLKRGERPWTVPPVMAELKQRAREAGLWNLFLAKSDHGKEHDNEIGVGLSNADYAPLAEIMGRS
jgi:alkylation response protein AidB-like acyl-CoA dehydrogenase